MISFLRKKYSGYCLFIACVLATGLSWAQEKSATTDSLKKVLSANMHDTLESDAAIELFLEYEFTDTLQARMYLDRALSIAQSKSDRKRLGLVYQYYGYLEEDLGRYQSALAYHEKSKLEREKIGDVKEIAKSLNCQGVVLEKLSEYQSSLEKYNHAMNLYLKLKDSSGLSATYNNIGVVYEKQGLYHAALKSYGLALSIFKKTRDINGLARAYNNIGVVYGFQGNYPEALKNHFSSLKIKEGMGDKKGMAFSYSNIGIIYYYLSDFEDALVHYQKALNLRIELNDLHGISACHNNFGILHRNAGNYEAALSSYHEALKIKEKLGDKFGISNALNNIGIVYLKMGEFKKAISFYEQSLIIEEGLENQMGIAESYNNLGIAHLQLGQFNKSKAYHTEAIKLSMQNGAFEVVMNGYFALAGADSALGDFRSAYNHHKKYLFYRDSLINEENTKKSMKLAMQYEYDKKFTADSVKHTEAQKRKDTEISVQQAIIREGNLKRNGLIAGVFVLLGFIIFVVNRYKLIKHQKEVILSQSIMVEKQRKIAEEKRALAESRKELIEDKNREIIDSINYAQRIQSAMLTSESYLRDNVGEAGNEKSYFILFQPKDIVSGDFYWFHRDGDELYYMTADCTGHGVPGGFMSMLSINLLNEIVIERGCKDPGLILDKLRGGIINALQTDDGFTKDGMDGVLCKLNYKTMHLHYAAANNSPYIIRNGEIKKLPTQKMPIGYSEKSESFKTEVSNLSDGDLIYTFTDGYPDQFGGERGKKFLSKQLLNKLLLISGSPMDEQHRLLAECFAEWKGVLEQIDDICLIGIKI